LGALWFEWSACSSSSPWVGCSGRRIGGRGCGTAGDRRARGVKLWQDASIFSLLGGMIEHARRRVLVEVYEIGRPDLIQEMSSARRRAVEVRVPPIRPWAASRASAARLGALGVHERFYPIDDAAHQIDTSSSSSRRWPAVGGNELGRAQQPAPRLRARDQGRR